MPEASSIEGTAESDSWSFGATLRNTWRSLISVFSMGTTAATSALANVPVEAIHERNSLIANKAGKYVLYWVQVAPRIHFNAALELACQKANEHGLPVVASFFIQPDSFPVANARHYGFMLQGLQEFQTQLASSRRIPLLVFHGSSVDALLPLIKNSCEIVADFGYLRQQRAQIEKLTKLAQCKLTQVETNVVVPVELASDKEEYAARTIRPKLTKLGKQFLITLESVIPNVSGLKLPLEKLGVQTINLQDNIENILQELKVDDGVAMIAEFSGGHAQALAMLETFLTEKLTSYFECNIPGADLQSNMSPYLSFGHISPVEIILKVQEQDAPRLVKDSYIEELFIRRELSCNMVYYDSKSYDSIKCLPKWASDTLRAHAKDKRPYIYKWDQLEKGATHDLYWNAAQLQMVYSGKMHGYMRMYWGKKVLEWSENVDKAYNWLISMNDKYELDGGDPNGYAGVAWVFGKHDTPHAERPIFGTIRYMNEDGLKRKFKKSLDEYVAHCYRLAQRKVPSEGLTKPSKRARKRKLNI